MRRFVTIVDAVDQTRESGRILIVEDDSEARRAIAAVLGSAGYRSSESATAEGVPAAVKENSPELVLLDVDLAGGDGFEVYARLREDEENRDTPVIFMSGSRLDEDSVVRALTGGACDFLRRPFGGAELIARVGVALRHRRAQLELRRLGNTDPLTGLSNRRAFFGALERERRRSHRVGCPLSVVVMDIDRFKSVNDAFGHPTGDRILLEVARILKTQCRATDLAARIGGEEFAVVLPHTDLEGARGLAEKLRSEIAGMKVRISDETSLGITASFGLARSLGYELDTPEDAIALLARADAGLYQAKRAGRDQVQVGVLQTQGA